MRRLTFFGVVERSSGAPRCQFLVRLAKEKAPNRITTGMTT